MSELAKEDIRKDLTGFSLLLETKVRDIDEDEVKRWDVQGEIASIKVVLLELVEQDHESTYEVVILDDGQKVKDFGIIRLEWEDGALLEIEQSVAFRGFGHPRALRKQRDHVYFYTKHKPSFIEFLKAEVRKHEPARFYFFKKDKAKKQADLESKIGEFHGKLSGWLEKRGYLIAGICLSIYGMLSEGAWKIFLGLLFVGISIMFIIRDRRLLSKAKPFEDELNEIHREKYGSWNRFSIKERKEKILTALKRHGEDEKVAFDPETFEKVETVDTFIDEGKVLIHVNKVDSKINCRLIYYTGNHHRSGSENFSMYFPEGELIKEETFKI